MLNDPVFQALGWAVVLFVLAFTVKGWLILPALACLGLAWLIWWLRWFR